MGAGKESTFSGLTALQLRRATGYPGRSGGRGRWKMETATFHTLQPQGYPWEHPDGPGQTPVTPGLGRRLRRAFLVDQGQEFGGNLFHAARQHFRSRTA